ncbi:MAG: hypothetical protein R2771_11135 [Saprospiraceae bacterium]
MKYSFYRAKTLKDNGINEFSIDGDYFIVSIIDFKSENYEQAEFYYNEKQKTNYDLIQQRKQDWNK